MQWDLAVIVGQDATALRGEPNFCGVLRRFACLDVNVYKLVVLVGPKEDFITADLKKARQFLSRRTRRIYILNARYCARIARTFQFQTRRILLA